MPRGGLKAAGKHSDREGVKRQNVSCPVCSANIPLGGDEVPGDEIYCMYCGAPCKLSQPRGDDDEMKAEEDF